jgi:hypothetical protein
MPRIRLPIPLILAAAAFPLGCQHTPPPSPAARPFAADSLALQQPVAPPPSSQPAGGGDAAAPPPGRHLLTIAGQINGGTGIVFVIDEDRDLLSAMTYVPQTKRIIHMDPINLDNAFGGGGPAAGSGTDRFAITGDGRTAHGQKYTAIICPLAQGEEALYLVNRAGIVVVFTFDNTTQRLDSRAVDSLSDVLK